MSTIQATNLKHNASASNNIVLDNAGNATFAGTAAMASSFLRNRIINGDMRIDQRNAGASVTPFDGQYTLDRWVAYRSQNSRFSVQQNAGSVTPPAGFTNYLGCTSLSAYSPISTDYFGVAQFIEGFNCADLAWGTASAQAVTISFWARSSLTGTFAVAVQNSAGNRSYIATYSISAANTWEFKSVTIPGDTSGTWLTNNGKGIRVWFDLGSGSNSDGPAGSWIGADDARTSGSVSLVATNGATFYVTGVQLEVGSAATPFERRQYGQELALCQRYYISTTGNSASIVFNGNEFNSANFPVTMRAAPTITITPTGGSITSGPVSNTHGFYARLDSTAGANYTAAIEL